MESDTTLLFWLSKALDVKKSNCVEFKVHNLWNKAFFVWFFFSQTLWEFQLLNESLFIELAKKKKFTFWLWKPYETCFDSKIHVIVLVQVTLLSIFFWIIEALWSAPGRSVSAISDWMETEELWLRIEKSGLNWLKSFSTATIKKCKENEKIKKNEQMNQWINCHWLLCTECL